MSDLFGNVFRPVRRTRKSNRAEVKRLKEKHGIWTNNAPGLGWLALSVPECHKFLERYNLTEEEKSNPIHLLSGYCRLLDDEGLTADGYATELAAVKAIADRIESKSR